MTMRDPRFTKPSTETRNPLKKDLNGFAIPAVLSAIIAVLSAIVLFIPFAIWSGVWALIWLAAAKASDNRKAHRRKTEELLTEIRDAQKDKQ